MLAVADGRPAAAAPGARCRWRRCPPIDAVIISHDHYDHLDIDTVKQLARTQRAKFFVPLGIGAHLRSWGIPADRIVELDWNESARIGELTLVCTPARHFSGRFLTRNTTLWSSWALIGPTTAPSSAATPDISKSFADIGAEHGPFDLTLMPVGRVPPGLARHPHESRGSGPRAPRRHRCGAAGADPLGDVPAGAASVVRAGGAAAQGGGVRRCAVAVPKPGQRVRPDAASPFDPWWRL